MAYKDQLINPKKTEKEVLPLTDHNIAESLYIINKSAKKSRDTKQNAYCLGRYSICNGAKTRSQKLYSLKDCVIEKLEQEGRIVFLGVCYQKHDYNKLCLKTYEMDGFRFHVPYYGIPKREWDFLPEITEVISAEKKIKTNINYYDALKILREYVNVESNET